MNSDLKSKLSFLGAVAVAFGLAVGIPLTTSAQEGAKGGGAKLVQSVAPETKAAPATAAKNCANCNESVVSVPDRDSKGGGKNLTIPGAATKLVLQHGCNACKTDWSVKGGGKAKVSVATHKCGSCT